MSQTLKMSVCLEGGWAGESSGGRLVNSSEKLPTSNSSVMYGLNGGATSLRSTADQVIA